MYKSGIRHIPLQAPHRTKPENSVFLKESYKPEERKRTSTLGAQQMNRIKLSNCK